MADISIQFHAAPDEIRDFVRQAVSDFSLHVIEVRFPPYQAIEVDPARLGEPWSYSSPYRELAFTIHRPALPLKKGEDVADKNPGVLRLMIGGRSEKGLVESWLSARTDDKAALAVWKKIAKRLKVMTEKGAIGFNPRNGASGIIRSHRYTAGAKELESDGVPMLAINDIVIKLGLDSDDGG